MPPDTGRTNAQSLGEMSSSCSDGTWPDKRRGSSASIMGRNGKPIIINCQDDVDAVAFLADGKHFVVGTGSKIRRWRVEDGKEAGKPIDAGSTICSIAVTRNGKWIVSGMANGEVVVWNAETHEKTTTLEEHSDKVYAVDVSPDGTKIASGSDDNTACVCSFSGGRLLGPLQHNQDLAAAKFSPDGSLIATATWDRDSVRIYCARSGSVKVDIPIAVISFWNVSLAWASDSRRLFALADGGYIHCLDTSTGAKLSKWSIGHASRCIALASNGTFIAASAGPSVSLWDTTTHRQIGSVVNHPHEVKSMAILANHTLVLGGGKTITIRNMDDMLPSSYLVDASDLPDRYSSDDFSLTTCQVKHPNEQSENLEKTCQQLREQLTALETAAKLEQDCLNKKIISLGADLRTRDESAKNQNTLLEETIRIHCDELAKAQHTADEQKDSLNEVIETLHGDLHALRKSSNENITLLEESNEKLRTKLASSVDEQESLYGIIKSLSNKITNLEQTNKELQTDMARSHSAADEAKGALDKTILSLRSNLHALEASSSEKITLLEQDKENLRNELIESKRAVDEQRAALNETIQSLQSDLHGRETSSNNKIALLEQTAGGLRTELAQSRQNAECLLRLNSAHERMHLCESLYAQGRVQEAAQSLSEMATIISEDTKGNQLVSDWLVEFTDRVVKMLESTADDALNAGKHDDAAIAYSTALSLVHVAPNTLSMKYIRTVLIGGTVQDALNAAAQLELPMFDAYQVICDDLEGAGWLPEAMRYFQLMKVNLPVDAATRDGRVRWERDFQNRCAVKLEKMGDAATESEKHDDAIRYYLDALIFDPANFVILLKHSEEVIKLDPSSHQGYEKKYSALHSMGRYNEAFNTFKTMLSVLERSPDPNIRQLRLGFIDATSAIRREIDRAIQDMPPVLIDTDTGRLYDKTGQAEAFKKLPIYDELRSSMTTRLDNPRIQREVEEFYQYVMLSHKWQLHEPTFQQVENASIYQMPPSPEFGKLQSFCKLACSLRFKWAWADTCCVNQLDKTVQQESVVAMFRWYRGSSLTVVHLFGVLSAPKEIGQLRRSIWNTRGWTYQEYVASRVVQFYTEDWKPYLGMDVFDGSTIVNHKESPVILEEMEQAMNLTTVELTMLQPGLDRIREKLYLASMRQTTRVEDIAYSLFGIFGVALSVIYGEGYQAVGRLLEHIVTRSDDVTILAWTGRSGGSHSYLPADLTVYNKIQPLHIPLPVDPAAMDDMAAVLHSSSFDLTLTEVLYHRLHDLPPLSLVAGRLRLPAIVFPLQNLVPDVESDPDPDLRVYRGTTPMLGDVVITTTTDLSGMGGLLLIHPWISPLLDRDFLSGVAQGDLAWRALRLVVRLRQSFGALLLAPLARAQYKRIATDSLIMVQLCEDISLHDLMGSVRTVDIQ